MIEKSRSINRGIRMIIRVETLAVAEAFIQLVPPERQPCQPCQHYQHCQHCTDHDDLKVSFHITRVAKLPDR